MIGVAQEGGDSRRVGEKVECSALRADALRGTRALKRPRLASIRCLSHRAFECPCSPAFLSSSTEFCCSTTATDGRMKSRCAPPALSALKLCVSESEQPEERESECKQCNAVVVSLFVYLSLCRCSCAVTVGIFGCCLRVKLDGSVHCHARAERGE